ncbi:MAG TPA: alpha/beta family hydrolase [Thermoanaerobaculia bacterium]|nr:alpha/beta family hydrolase [Thermoanaerobaculia bacterium]
MIPKLTDGSSDSAVFLFAHGAGAPMDSPFMTRVAGGIAAHGIQVVRFEFPYMAARREGARRPPDREPILRFTWAKLIDQHRDGRKVFIGGKSMGGRIATMVADETGVDGVVCFGYPFHPPGRPETLRIRHLQSLQTPLLIIQGTRDALGSQPEVSSLELSKNITIRWIGDGDHSLKPRVRSGRTEDQNVEEAIQAAAAFMNG